MIEIWYSWLLDYGKNKQISKLTLVLSRNTGPCISFQFSLSLVRIISLRGSTLSSSWILFISPLQIFNWSCVIFLRQPHNFWCFAYQQNHIFFDWFKITISLAFVCNFQNLVSKSRFKRVTGLEYRRNLKLPS